MIPPGKLEPQQTEAWILSWHAIHHINSYLGVSMGFVIKSRLPDRPFSFWFPGFRLKTLIAPGAPQKAYVRYYRLWPLHSAFSSMTWREPCVGKQPLSLSVCVFTSRRAQSLTISLPAPQLSLLVYFIYWRMPKKEQVLRISATLLS